ncbi:MAG: hypothetical protein E4H06_03245 [Methanosarcina sp.]|nr:MAG: hypothetical protein E4H06_03245 [Methanosarcina sp.]
MRQFISIYYPMPSLRLVSWSHIALGRNWSPILEIRKGHILVTAGPYRFIRHLILQCR